LQDWDFASIKYDLITFSLVLEHIENLEPVFEQVSKLITGSGHVYIGELHPFKQYSGSKARFTTEEGEQVLTCFHHHISDFTKAAIKYGLTVIHINEYFDEAEHNTIPRILSMLFKSPNV
jgi:2-polyprenyl-3-methyl-5-hydroxy-6-metoxy-1,4-benzoquinol methylase